MLTADEIQLIMSLLAKVVVVPRTKDFPYEVVRDVPGYSDDPKIGKLQAKLSIMLEVARKRPS